MARKKKTTRKKKLAPAFSPKPKRFSGGQKLLAADEENLSSTDPDTPSPH